MRLHRYQYLYLPISRFFSRLSPQAQLLLIVVKVIFIFTLIGFEYAQADSLLHLN